MALRSVSKFMPVTGSLATPWARSRPLPEIRELNIGHFLVGEAIFCGLDASIRRMRALMDEARAMADGRNTA
jgi:hypothetical protein